MINFEDIKKANESIATTNIKGKEYAEVNQRVKAFRMVHPNGQIMTDIVAHENGVVCIKATVCDADGAIIATGMAYEKESSSFINKTSYIENCETSAVGRALGFAGYGIDTSICSAEDLNNALENQQNEKPATELMKKTFMDMCKKLDVDYKVILKQVGVTGKITEGQYGKCMIVLKEIEASK